MLKNLTSSLYKKIIIAKRYYRSKQYKDLQKCYITCAGKSDGAGAQALAILSTQLFAYDTGIKYVHTPFQSIQHNYENNPYWEKDWEDFFGLGEGELKINELDMFDIKCLHISDISQIDLNSSGNLYIVSQCHDYANLFPNRYKNIKESLLSKYLVCRKKKNINGLGQLNKVNVAIHVRRGDIKSKGKFSERYTDNYVIISILQKVMPHIINTGLKISIKIYSQGQPEDFQDILNIYQNYDANLHLNECAFKTFDALVNADILLMSKSTFSYAAALLSDGIKIYEPFYHPPLNDWFVCEKNYNFNQMKFQKALEAVICEKNNSVRV